METSLIDPKTRRKCPHCRRYSPAGLRCACEMGADFETLDTALVEVQATPVPLVETCDPDDRIQTVREAAGAWGPHRLGWSEIATLVLLVVIVLAIFASGPRAVDQTMARQEAQSRMGQEVQYDRP